MLIQTFDWLERTRPPLPHLEAALACLAEHREAPAPARFAFSGGFLLLQEGTTRPLWEGDFEAHRRDLDLQVLLRGQELLAWADLPRLSPARPYDPDSDKAMYTGRPDLTLTVPEGSCYILWPEDGHKACRHTLTAAPYRKAVIKLEL